MANNVEVCNMALGKLGQDVRIAALSDQSKAARAFASVFDQTRDYVLTDAKFPFATKVLPLALAPDAAFGWRFRYAYPADCLDARVVTTQAWAEQLVLSFGGGYVIDERMDAAYRHWREPFEVDYGQQGTGILTNVEGAYLIHTIRVDDLGRWPPLAIEALACRVAIVVAPIIAAEIGLKLGATLEQKYQFEKSRALTHALNESSEADDYVTPALAARL